MDLACTGVGKLATVVKEAVVEEEGTGGARTRPRAERVFTKEEGAAGEPGGGV